MVTKLYLNLKLTNKKEKNNVIPKNEINEH